MASSRHSTARSRSRGKKSIATSKISTEKMAIPKTIRELVALVMRHEDELIGIRRRLGLIEDKDRHEQTYIGVPPPPLVPTRTDPYDIRDMDDEPTRREKRPL